MISIEILEKFEIRSNFGVIFQNRISKFLPWGNSNRGIMSDTGEFMNCTVWVDCNPNTSNLIRWFLKFSKINTRKSKISKIEVLENRNSRKSKFSKIEILENRNYQK